jgi:hypothetical protein
LDQRSERGARFLVEPRPYEAGGHSLISLEKERWIPRPFTRRGRRARGGRSCRGAT